VHRKGSGATWGTLQAAQTVSSAPVVGRYNVHDGTAKPAYPTSSKTKRDWDELNIAAKKEEKEDNKDGPAALHSLFQGIYGDGDEDTRRAMIKSYQTSGGTVLSTNWKEVQKKDYEKELEAPKGQEFRKWTD
jgi:suppressor of G2 allele of SKP1